MNGSRLQWLLKFQSAWAKMDKSILMPESDVNLQAWLDPGMSRMQKYTLYVYVYTKGTSYPNAARSSVSTVCSSVLG